MHSIAVLLLLTSLSAPPSPYRGIYLNAYAVANRRYFRDILERMEDKLNTVVIDMKLDSGVIPYSSDVSLARNMGAVDPIIGNPEGLVSKMRERGIYLIARLIVFKDSTLGRYENGKYAVRDRAGEIWVDGNGDVWVDPFSEEAGDYILEIARELALSGFDEIQFDYLRFPTDGDVADCVYPHRQIGEGRADAIARFLKKARRVLAPLGARIGVDLFGFAAWRESLSLEGQNIQTVGKYVDTVYPMLYPSHFGSFMGELASGEREYKIIYESTRRAKERLSGTGAKLVIYLQGFDWRASGYGSDYVRDQIEAAMRGGASGWIIWHSGSNYSTAWEATKIPLPMPREKPLEVRIGKIEFIPPDPGQLEPIPPEVPPTRR